MNGDYCCKTKEERPVELGITPQNEIDAGTCDGLNFNRQSTCCKSGFGIFPGPTFLPCPHGSGCFDNSPLLGADCGGVINMESEQLKSPEFPNNYPNDKICYWTITVPFGFSVTLDFETFEVSLNASVCQYDYVEIRDGGDLTSKMLGKFCGDALPGSIRSTGNQLFVKFHSDKSYSRKGFSASFVAIPKGMFL